MSEQEPLLGFRPEEKEIRDKIANFLLEYDLLEKQQKAIQVEISQTQKYCAHRIKKRHCSNEGDICEICGGFV